LDAVSDHPLLPTRSEVVVGAQVDPAQKLARTQGRSPRAISARFFRDVLSYPVDTGGGTLQAFLPVRGGIPEGGFVAEGGYAGQVVEVMFAAVQFLEE
jgi:hypothetical protein